MLCDHSAGLGPSDKDGLGPSDEDGDAGSHLCWGHTRVTIQMPPLTSAQILPQHLTVCPSNRHTHEYIKHTHTGTGHRYINKDTHSPSHAHTTHTLASLLFWLSDSDDEWMADR